MPALEDQALVPFCSSIRDRIRYPAWDMPIMRFGYTIAYVPDVATALAFYESAFGIAARFVHQSGDYGELATGETVLAFASYELGESNLPAGITRLSDVDPPAGIEVALVTDDVHAAMRKAVEAGAELIVEAHEKPWGQTVGYVRAPDGLLIELCTPVGG